MAERRWRTRRTSRPQNESAVHRLHVTAIAKGGDGIAELQLAGRRRVVLLPQTAPGDVVSAKVYAGSSTPRGEVLEIVEPSPDRVVPLCPHATRCGGCDLMHLTVQAQHRVRLAIVTAALERARIPAPPPRYHEAPFRNGYRSRARLAVECLRGNVRMGYRARRSHELVEVDRCLILADPVEAARLQLRDWFKGSEGRGEITIGVGAEQRPTMLVAWRGVVGNALFAQAERATREGSWSGVELRMDGARAPAIIGDARAEQLSLDGHPLRTPAGGFQQAFLQMNETLVRAVAESARGREKTTLELFSGAGNFSVALAPLASALETVEADPALVEAARANLAVRGLRAKLREHDANTFVVPSTTRVAVLDPPRAGARGACERLVVSKVQRVVLVSCDPATLARDLSILTAPGAFAVSSIDLFEMFPHTSHIEALVVLDRGARA